jgi:hypothetical protein
MRSGLGGIRTLPLVGISPVSFLFFILFARAPLHHCVGVYRERERGGLGVKLCPGLFRSSNSSIVLLG